MSGLDGPREIKLDGAKASELDGPRAGEPDGPRTGLRWASLTSLIIKTIFFNFNLLPLA